MSLIPNTDPPLLKQEKAFGNLLLALGGVGGIVALYFALPYLIAVAWGTLQLATVGGLLFIMYYLATSDLIRTHGAKVFRMMVRKTSRVFISYDPVGALQDHIIYLRECLGKFDQKRNTLAGIIENIQRQIENSSKEYETAMQMAMKSKEVGDAQQLNLQGRKAKRKKETVEALTKMLNRLSSVLSTLVKLRSEAQYLILDTEDEVNEMVIRHGAMTAAGTALEEALKIIEGDPEMSAMFKDTMSAMELDIRERVGMIEMVMTNADGLIGGIDVKNATINEQTLRELESWSDMRLRSDKSPVTQAATSPLATQDALRAALARNAAEKVL